MKLLILCVDGFDPDYAEENGYARFPYQRKLSIPKECYVMTEEGEAPHTTKVWPTIFSGKPIGNMQKVRGPLRQRVHDFLVKKKVTWDFAEKQYKVNPYNRELDLVFNHYNSFIWNIPTISPAWIAYFPSYNAYIDFVQKEYIQWQILSRGAIHYPFELIATYTRILDSWGHNKPEKLDTLYLDIVTYAEEISKHIPTILVSDHGCLNGIHTHKAYIGSTEPVKANSVTEVRNDIETIIARARNMEGSIL